MKEAKEESTGWKESESTCNRLYSELLDENKKLIALLSSIGENPFTPLSIKQGITNLLSTKGDT